MFGAEFRVHGSCGPWPRTPNREPRTEPRTKHPEPRTKHPEPRTPPHRNEKRISPMSSRSPSSSDRRHRDPKLLPILQKAMLKKASLFCAAALCCAWPLASHAVIGVSAASALQTATPGTNDAPARQTYVLGPDDQIVIHAVDV